MERIKLENTTLENTYFEYLYLILDNQGKIVFLPFLWLIHMGATQSHYTWKVKSISDRNLYFNQNIERVFEQNDLSENTIKNYIGHFYSFINYINEDNENKDNPGIHSLERTSDRYINRYLNKYLPTKLQSSKALIAHQAALNSFFNFLNYLEIRTAPITRINPKTKKYLANTDIRQKKISYISRSDRKFLIRECSSKRDKLMLRMGFEVGLRTSECCGLPLKDFKFKRANKPGLLSLFDSLKKQPNKTSFSFYLHGKHTKGGKSRVIYFDRELLESMLDYYETERKLIIDLSLYNSETLFIRHDPKEAGKPISTKQGSNIFTKLRKKIPHLNQTLSYHDLRHTFATELYHQELRDKNGRETRSESAALFIVSQRLGHKDSKHSTKLYIRIINQLQALESMENKH